MSNALANFAVTSPFLLAILIANHGERKYSWRVALYIYLMLLNSVMIVLGFGSIVAGYLAHQPGLVVNMPSSFATIDLAGAGATLMIAGTIAMLVLIPSVRRLAARLIPIDSTSVVHATALSLTATAIGFNLFSMTINRLLLTPERINQLQQTSEDIYIGSLVFPLLVLSLAALLSVGWLTRRSWGEVVERLGLTAPTTRQLGLAAVVTVGLMVLAIGTGLLWKQVDPNGMKDVDSIMSALMNDVKGVNGALAIGITAGIGEELFFRGAYQKRMGILLTALLFASFHTQYFISIATLLVFVIGLVLGVLRQRTSLTICILVHFSYNFISVLLGS